MTVTISNPTRLPAVSTMGRAALVEEYVALHPDHDGARRDAEQASLRFLRTLVRNARLAAAPRPYVAMDALWALDATREVARMAVDKGLDETRATLERAYREAWLRHGEGCAQTVSAAARCVTFRNLFED